MDRGDNSEIFYGKFIGFGTSKMSARPFLQPAYEKNKDNIQKL
ncbi:HK97-gp10 family putative phage morphogenesis protein [Clostridium kluyveri]|nr:HK97-gp10 family putative phage morphogenesis protein [Clostridium kluyveri]